MLLEFHELTEVSWMTRHGRGTREFVFCVNFDSARGVIGFAHCSACHWLIGFESTFTSSLIESEICLFSWSVNMTRNCLGEVGKRDLSDVEVCVHLSCLLDHLFSLDVLVTLVV